jgi:hypothetical protein
LKDEGIRACVPGRKQRKTPNQMTVSGPCFAIPCLGAIQIMFGRLKDRRRVATRYDRSPKVFLSAIARATPVIYWS